MGSKRSISSGKLYNSESIVSTECFLIDAILMGGEANAKVTFYDSDSQDIADAVEVGFISQKVPKLDCSKHCLHGIYAEAEDGAEFMVGYNLRG